ncbi:MAG TPA: PhzF family phenazine biosynthesis protein [Chloroflexota bacterium]|nr:PhzF family phenazine biosynthesis protein [Chloroflexota bacterium]
MRNPERQILVVDAFTSRPYAGNPAAVVPDASGLADWQMQTIARDMNLSETVFVSTSRQATARVRFFTPTTELPLAGHPTLAAWHALTELGRVDMSSGGGVVTQELNVGVLPVEIRPDLSIFMTQKPPEFIHQLDPGPVAKALHLQAGLLDPRVRPTVVSTGTPQLMVLLRSAADLQALRPDMTLLAEHAREHDYAGLHVFALGGVTPRGQAQARHFAPSIGIDEDPVTGSASGGMAAFLVHHKLIEQTELMIEQGHILGRPGEVHAEVQRDGARVTGVRIGGQCVTVLRGAIRDPEGL